MVTRSSLESVARSLSGTEPIPWAGLVRSVQQIVGSLVESEPQPSFAPGRLTAVLAELLAELRAKDRDAALGCIERAIGLIEAAAA